MYNPNEQYPIIEIPNSRKNGRYWLERIIAAVATALVWYFFSQYVVGHLLAAEEKTVSMTWNLLVIIAFAVGILIYWQAFNILMYGKKERRKAFPEQSAEYVAQLYGITAQELGRVQKARRVTLKFYDGEHHLFTDQQQKPIRLGMRLE